MRFCFFGPISGSLQDNTRGGAELQVALLAKALASIGHEVVIIDPYAKESFVTNEGIKLVNIPGWNRGIRGFRLFWNRIPTLWKLFKSVKADYYYVRMRSYLHLIPYLVSRKLGAKFIVGVAHDLDILSLKEKLQHEYRTRFNFIKYITINIPNDLVFKYIIKRADYVTLQHSGQKLKPGLLKGKVVIFPNIIDLNNISEIKGFPGNYFVHVGTLTVLKGTRNLFELTELLDKKVSVMIIGQAVDKKSKKLIELLSKKENINFKGRLSHSETINLIANSKALINTSNYEGFPNIFLEAWATGVPVVSLKVNPGSVLEKYHLGICCDGDLKKMKDILESNTVSQFDKGKLISYVRRFHDLAGAGERFINQLNKAS